MDIKIEQAYGDIDTVKALFQAYTQMLNIDLSFQKYKEELEGLPAKNALPGGSFYIAWCGGVPAGCIAMRPLDNERCEMKRLYVKPQFRGHGLGKALARQVIEDAKALKHKKMLLDTLASFENAIALYKALGFYAIEPYYHNPIADTLYLCLDL